MVLYRVCFVLTDQAMIRRRASNNRSRSVPFSEMFPCLTASQIDENIEEYKNVDFVFKIYWYFLIAYNLKKTKF